MGRLQIKLGQKALINPQETDKGKEVWIVGENINFGRHTYGDIMNEHNFINKQVRISAKVQIDIQLYSFHIQSVWFSDQFTL